MMWVPFLSLSTQLTLLKDWSRAVRVLLNFAVPAGTYFAILAQLQTGVTSYRILTQKTENTRSEDQMLSRTPDEINAVDAHNGIVYLSIPITRQN